ncbi:DEKNAAC104247 [Brettanomyces naardenensis]|uniref:DEKNAAC104247 n=1 Tax=Brettanomyces naardenensis TaxID=13370 RepID=A0A448YQQ7_BRENA|nr:DEKNAAC104247 [Brettanomyces naardenensis]
MSLTMIGDSILSYFLTWNANVIGTRRVMRIGSFLMFACGLVFASGTTNFHLLLTAAIFGVISPSGGDTGPFKTIEEAVLAKLTPLDHRPEVYGIHGTLAAIGSSCGNFGAGLFVDVLVSKYGLSYRDAYRWAFVPFCAISMIKFVSMLFMSVDCEVEEPAEPGEVTSDRNVAVGGDIEETAEQSGAYSHLRKDDSSSSPSPAASLEPVDSSSPLIPPEDTTFNWLTRSRTAAPSVALLLVPFMIDSFGYGFMPSAWVVYYFKMRYLVGASTLGLIFGATDLIQSLSAIPSAWFSKHLGPITSTLVTQIPCGIFFICIPFLGTTLPRATILYLLNQATTAFDVVPRQIILTSLMEPRELPKVLGTVNIGKQVARSISPFFTGLLAERGHLWVCFWITGTLLIIANLVLWWILPPERSPKEQLPDEQSPVGQSAAEQSEQGDLQGR